MNGRTASAYTAAERIAPATIATSTSATALPAASESATGVLPEHDQHADEHRADDDIAVRERDHAGQPVDEREAERDQAVGRSGRQPGDERLDRDRAAHSPRIICG